MPEGSPPTTRFSTALEADCCTKRVVSPAPMENRGQLMMAPGALVTVSVLPEVWNWAEPAATLPPVGLAPAVEQKASRTAQAAGRKAVPGADTVLLPGDVACLLPMDWLLSWELAAKNILRSY